MLWPKNVFPGTNLQDLNLDWVLKKIKALRGGATGQYLYKKSDADFDFGWKTGGEGGTSDYLDLDNKPRINNVELSGNKTASELGLATPSDIPEIPVQSVNGKTGAVVLNAADVGAYSKPETGIPKTDLSSPVQESLNKADTALQAVPSTYRTAAAQDVIDAEQDAQIKVISRPNLLDNWYFIGGGSQQGGGQFPINQRGQTYYANPGYTIDRWFLAGNTVAMAFADTHQAIIIGDNSELRQNIENGYSNLVGKTVTLSVLTTTSLVEVTGVVASSGISVSKDFEGRQMYIDSGNGNQSYITVVIKNIDSDGQFKAVKLELGSYQTLAHNEGTEATPNWVLNEIPDYGQELQKCQRYYEAGIGYTGAWPISNSFDTSIPFKVTKAKTPTFENLSCLYWTGSGFASVPNAEASVNGAAPLFSVRITSAGNEIPAESIYILSVAASADL